MKSSEFLFLTIILVVVLFLSLSTSSITPYVRTNLHPYESFTTHHSATDYSNSSDNSAMDSYKSFLIDSGARGDCKKVFGFDGLYCQPGSVNDKLDIFGDAKGSLDAPGTGLTNSKGSLRLDDKMTKMLTSRGGNATGGDSQIGGK